MAADPVLSGDAHRFRTHLIDVHVCAYFDRFDATPDVGTEVVARYDGKAGVWTTCGLLIGYLPPEREEPVQREEHRGTVVETRPETEPPVVLVELVRDPAD